VYPNTLPSDTRTIRAPGGVVPIDANTKKVGSRTGCASTGGWDCFGGTEDVGSDGGGKVRLLRCNASAIPEITATAKTAQIAIQNFGQTFTVVPGIDANCIALWADVQRLIAKPRPPMVGRSGFIASPATRERSKYHSRRGTVVYLTKMLGTGGASMLGLMRKPV